MRSLKLNLQFVAAFSFLFVLLTAIAVTNTVTADEAGTVAETISHSPTDEELSSVLFSAENTSAEYTSPIFDAQFEFNGLGLTWNGPENADVTFYIKTDVSDWETLPMMGNESKDKVEAFVSHPLFISGKQVRYRITGADIAHVRNVRITYFDSTTAPEVSLLQNVTSSMQRNLTGKTSVNVISREEWGANESYRVWEPEYMEPQKFIVHHTAGSDGGSDPASTVRGIYYWHAIVLGWGDIGYNYIVDQQGNVYEGRYDGDATPKGKLVVGAHTYDSENALNYNYYAGGVAILGCFEEGACGSGDEYNDDIHNSLTNLLAEKSVEFGIKPNGKSVLFGNSTKNIVGHGDVDSTSCPGNLVHDKLKSVRKKTAKKYKALKASKIKNYHGAFVSDTFVNSYPSGSIPAVSIVYKNIGKKDWAAEDISMQVNLVERKKRQRILLTKPVIINDTATFNFDWNNLPKKSGDYIVSTRLYRNGKPIAGTNTQYTITVTHPYQVTLNSHTTPAAILKGWIPTTKLNLTNTGTRTIRGSAEVILNGEVEGTLGIKLRPGDSKTATIALPSLSSLKPGTHDIKLYLRYKGTNVYGSRISQSIRVDKK